jgi:large subunit ribosomal protein L28
MRRFYDGCGKPVRLDAPDPRHYTSAVHCNRYFRCPRGIRVNSKGNAMSRRCDLTGKGVLVGHTVSHSNIKTKRRFLPNLLNVTMISDTLGRSVRLRVSANALKTVDHSGGLDAYLVGAKNDVLAPKMRDLKKAIVKKQAKAG